MQGSIIKGVFPEAIKITKVIPTLKAGDPLDVNNYRHISLLSIFSKIIEKLVHHRLNSFLQQHRVIYESQFGFQKGKSTIYSLIEIVEQIIFIDLKKLLTQ